MKLYPEFDTPIERRHTESVKWDADLPTGVTLTPEQRERMIPLWVADMDFAAAPCIREAVIRRAEHGIYGYAEPGDSFYEAIIRWFRDRHGLTLQREWIRYCAGVVPAMSAVIHALAKPGEGVIILTPVYNCFFRSTQTNDCREVHIPLLRKDLADGRFTYTIDYDALEAACSDPTNRILLFCNPHNPAGRQWRPEELRRVGEIALRHGTIVVSDEIHCEVAAPGTAYTPFASISEEFLRGSITLSSPSKSFNTAGLQTSNIFVAREDWREAIVRALVVHKVDEVNPFGPIALEAAYSEGGARWLDEMNTVVWRNYDYLLERFRSELPDCPVAVLETTYLAWVDISARCDSSAALERRLLQEQQVWVNPGIIYGTEGYIRINLACPFAQLRDGLDRVIAGMK